MTKAPSHSSAPAGVSSPAPGRSPSAIAGAGDLLLVVGAADLSKLPPAGDANYKQATRRNGPTEHPRREDDPAGAVYFIRSGAHLVGECFLGPWQELG